jgi:predicted acyltransferase
MGILQRLSICYGAILCYHLSTNYGESKRRKFGGFIMLILYLVYLSLMISFEGGDILGCSKENNLTDPCNIAGYIDRKVFTFDHMLKHVYTDPEGLFSTIGAIITTYMGYEYSILMSKYKENPKQLVSAWLSIAVILGAITYPMYLAFPFNKKLYTPSFILIVGAVSGASLTFFYFLVDILPTIKPKSKRAIEIIFSPLLWLGLNPLAIFVLMDLLGIFFILYIHVDGLNLWSQFFNHVFASWISDDTLSALAFAFFFVVLWTIVAGIMHRFKFYVRL